jgi:hypothetical protein
MLVRISFGDGPSSADRAVGRRPAPRAGTPSRAVDAPPSAPATGPVAQPGRTWKGVSAELPTRWRRSAAWRQAVQRRRMSLLDDLLRLDDAAWNAGQVEEREFLIGTLLEDVNLACQARVGLRKWWCGTEIERAWARLREVEERSVDLLPEQELPVRALDALAHADQQLEGQSRRQAQLCSTLAGVTGSGPGTLGVRAAIVDVLRASHEQSDRNHQAARSLRNRLVLASVMSVLFAVSVVAAQAALDQVRLLPLPVDWSGPAAGYLGLVMLFGAVGALFTAIPAMSGVPSDPSPFNMPLQQALLKLTFGPLVAFTGLGVLSADPLGASGPTGLSALLFLALIFGAGQQGVTRYVDRRADEILRAEGGSGADGGSPRRTPTAPEGRRARGGGSPR